MLRLSTGLVLFQLSTALMAATITVPVTNADAYGPNGLEEAINTVNAGDPNDIYMIEIDVSSNQIDITSPLPTITQRAVIIRSLRDPRWGKLRLNDQSVDYLLYMAATDAVFYAIENLWLRRANDGCATMIANTVQVTDSIFSDCQLQPSNTSALSIQGSATIRNSEFFFMRWIVKLAAARALR